jgi:predicted DNA-binding transcriptional regulator AlpA
MQNAEAVNDQLLTIENLLQQWQISKRTYVRMRLEGQGPRVTRIRGCVRYRRSDVEAWLVEQASQSV